MGHGYPWTTFGYSAFPRAPGIARGWMCFGRRLAQEFANSGQHDALTKVVALRCVDGHSRTAFYPASPHHSPSVGQVCEWRVGGGGWEVQDWAWALRAIEHRFRSEGWISCVRRPVRGLCQFKTTQRQYLGGMFCRCRRLLTRGGHYYEM